MIEVCINGSVHRVKFLIAELETGEELSITAPVVTKPLVYTPPIMIESTPVETPVALKKERKPRKPRAKKAAAPVEAAPVEAAPVEAAVESPAPVAAAKATRKGGFRRARKRGISIPLHECEAVAMYPKNDGSGEFMVAVWHSGTRGNGSKWFQLLFVTKDMETAFHPTDPKGFYGDPAKIKDITPIG